MVLKNMAKFNLKTFIIIAATAALAVIAIFTAWRLYELRRQAVAPTAPKKGLAAETKSCAPLTFTLAQASISPSPTASPTASPSPSPTRSPSPTASATAGPTSSPTSTPSATSSPSATQISQATSSPTSTKSPTAKPTATAQAQLPQAGVSWPAVGAAIGGILLLALGALLAF